MFKKKTLNFISLCQNCSNPGVQTKGGTRQKNKSGVITVGGRGVGPFLMQLSLKLIDKMELNPKPPAWLEINHGVKKSAVN